MRTLTDQMLADRALSLLDGKMPRSAAVEKIIPLAKKMLQRSPRATDPYRWALMQSALGSFYLTREAGNRRQNLRRAIQYCQNALTIFSRRKTPRRWAAITEDLADALFHLENGSGEAYVRKIESHLEGVAEVHDQQKNRSDLKVVSKKLKLVRELIQVEAERKRLLKRLKRA